MDVQRIINDPDYVVEDMLRGFLKNHRDLVTETENPRVIKYIHTPVKNKVGIVTGGGSGHKPAFIGYVGKNLVDVAAVGEIFSSPSAQSFYDAIVAADSGNGVAVLYGNYAGDNMNVRMAMEMAREDGIRVEKVVANDDVASAAPDECDRRRGVAGEVFMWKVGGAKAASGGTLEEVVQSARKAIGNTRSVGIGLSPCTIPAVGHPNFLIEDGTMELGIGHHGEPGVRVEKLGTADEMAEMMVDMVLKEMDFAGGGEAAVLLSGLGATPVMEQYILYNKVEELLSERGIGVYRSYVGNYFTSLEMMGATLTLMKLDEELKELLDMECESMGMTQFGR